MKLKIFSGIAFTTALLLSGCGSDDTTCRMDVQAAMDKGEFDTAVNKLEGTCKNVYESADLNYNLAIAYMGKAGYSITDILITLIDAGDAQDDGNGTTFTNFTASITENKQANSALDMQTSQEYFRKALAGESNTSLTTFCDQTNLDNNDSILLNNTCLYYGFNQILTTVDSLSYLTKDVDKAMESIDGTGDVPLDFQASLDALSWSVNIQNIINVTPNDITLGGTDFKHLTILEDGKTFYRLANSLSPDAQYGTTILTDGYCDADGNKTACNNIVENEDGSVDGDITGCYACPVGIEYGLTLDTVQVLVDAINNGIDAASNTADDEETKQDISDLKKDMDIDNSGEVSVEEMIDYLNK